MQANASSEAHFNPFKRSLTNDPNDQPIESDDRNKSISNDDCAVTSQGIGSLQRLQLPKQTPQKSQFLRVLSNNP
jgi:hypothetical protein